jgi:hypothetical protein
MIRLTIRCLDSELEKRLRELSAQDNSSLNDAALKLMRRGAGIESASSPRPRIGRRLRAFAGRMPKAEAKAIDRAVCEARQTDVTHRG